MDKEKEKKKKKKKKKPSHLLTRYRGFVQAAATLATNIHLPNFLKGSIYTGGGKAVCVPGLNCYSCPAATGACPIGSFQAVAGSSKFRLFDIIRRAFGQIYMRISLPVRMVSGFTA